MAWSILPGSTRCGRSTRFYGRRLITHEIAAERANHVDEPYHLKLAELLMRQPAI